MKTHLMAMLATFIFTTGMPATGAPPAGFIYQGRLADKDGVNREGNFELTFSVFDSATNGTLLWRKALPVSVRKGQFQVMIQGLGERGDGRSYSLEEALSPVSVAYLELMLAGEQQAMSPRQPLFKEFLGIKNSVGNAGDLTISADNNSAGTGGIFLKTGANNRMEIANSGNVGIGASNIPERLVVNGIIESLSGGFIFPDGTAQTTARSSVNVLPPNCKIWLKVISASLQCTYSNYKYAGYRPPESPPAPQESISCSNIEGFNWKIDMAVCLGCFQTPVDVCGPITSITLREKSSSLPAGI